MKTLFACNPAREAVIAWPSALEASDRAVVASGVRLESHSVSSAGVSSPQTGVDGLVIQRTTDSHHTIHTLGKAGCKGHPNQRSQSMTDQGDLADTHFMRKRSSREACCSSE